MSAGVNDSGVVNSLDVLAPAFRRAVETARAACVADGLDVVIYETFRSQERQYANFTRGATNVSSTNASNNLYSWHSFGLAVDVVSASRGWTAWTDADWSAKVVRRFRENGCRWGGEWVSRDLPHFQWAACKPSPSDRARALLAGGGLHAVWEAVGAL